MLNSKQQQSNHEISVAPLVLPHEFYCRNRGLSAQSQHKFRKDLSEQITISFSQKKVKRPRIRCRVKGIIHKSTHERQEPTLRHVNLNRHLPKQFSSHSDSQQFESKSDGFYTSKADVTNSCIEDESKGTESKLCNNIETKDICNLVYEIKSILNSDMFVNQLLEDDLLQEANVDDSDMRWKDHFSKFVIPIIHERGKYTRNIYEKYEMIQRKSEEKCLSQTFRAWRRMTVRFMKKDVVEKVDRLDVTYYHSKKRDIFHVLSSLSVGTSSRKKILQRRRDGLTRARESLIGSLKKKNEVQGIITNQMVQRELRRIFHTELYDWNRKRYLEICFVQWKVLNKRAKEVNLLATCHLKQKILKKWRIWSFNQMIVLSGDCDDRYQKFLRAETFCTRIQLQKSFRAWRIKSNAYTNANRMQRRILTRFVRDIMIIWLQMTKQRRAIKVNVLAEWLNYHSFVIGRPFFSWRDITVSMRRTRQDQRFFLKSYKQVKRRQLQWKIFRTWRHQARYGRVTSMYTRQDLLKLLAEKDCKIEELQSQMNQST